MQAALANIFGDDLAGRGGNKLSAVFPLPTGMLSFEEDLLIERNASLNSAHWFVGPLRVWREMAEADGWAVTEGPAAFAQPDLSHYDTVVVKSALHFAAGFAPVATRIVYVSASGSASPKLDRLILLASRMTARPRILVLHEPTRGVDIGARAQIHDMLRDEARAGLPMLMITSDLEEAVALGDRLLVMREGRLVGELTDAGRTRQAAIALAAGTAQEEVRRPIPENHQPARTAPPSAAGSSRTSESASSFPWSWWSSPSRLRSF